MVGSKSVSVAVIGVLASPTVIPEQRVVPGTAPQMQVAWPSEGLPMQSLLPSPAGPPCTPWSQLLTGSAVHREAWDDAVAIAVLAANAISDAKAVTTMSRQTYPCPGLPR